MPETPLQFIHIGEIGGDREDAESLALPDIFSSDGSRNVFMDKEGRATTILGYNKATAAAVTSNTGGEAQRLRALYLYGLRAGVGSVIRTLFGFFEGATTADLRKSTDGGATWQLVAELGSTFVGKIPDFAQLGNQLILTFGTGAARTFDGGTFSNASSTQLPAPTVASLTTIGLLDGSYQWKIVPVKVDGTRKPASVASTTLSVNKKQVTVTWTADTEAAVYEVYRTTGTGKVYFYETALPTGTLTFTSNTADLQLIAGRVLQEFGDAPSTGIYYAEAHSERMFYGGTDGNPRRVWYSDPGLPYSVSDGNFFDFTDAESFSDVYVGGTGNFRGMFVAWLERSVWTISGKGVYSGVVIDYVRRRTDAQVGAVTHRAVARVPAGSVFVDAQGRAQQTSQVMLAYLTPLGDVRLFDGNNDVIISWPKKDTFRRLSYASRQKAFALLDVNRSEITWVFPIDNAVENNYAVTWNMRNGQMVERQWSFAHAIVIDANTDAAKILAGESNTAVGGHCYEVFKAGTNTFDGTAISGRLATKTIYAHDRNGAALMEREQRWRWVDILVKELDLSNSYTVEWFGTESDLQTADGSKTGITLDTSVLQSADADPLQSADADPLVAGLGKGIIRVILKSAHASGIRKAFASRGLRLRITNTGGGQIAVVGMTIAFQALGNIKQTFRH